MPRYAPLPAVNIDPRNEAQLVNEAAKRVYDASNAKLNDFSAGNPLMALIEGQAFAQGEFLFWANQLPESILIEWIGPFLGAMRRLGTPSVSRLTLEVAATGFQQVIPAGTVFSTNANLTDGESIEFISTSDLVLAANETVGSVAVASSLVGTFNNVAPNTVTSAPSIDVQILSVTNTIAAVGGSDIEPLDQTKERFFTLIRRRNPVSAQDWQDLFEDLFGVGTFCSVLANRSTKDSFIWLNDYVYSDGHVSFFFLNPDGTEPTQEQVKRAQNVVDFSLPLEMQGHVYPLDLSQVQFNLDLSYDPSAEYAGFLRNFSLDVRDRLFQIMTPGNTFPSGYDASVADVDAAFVSSFPEDTRYSDPDILTATAYNTPLAANPSSLVSAPSSVFTPQTNSFSVNDLLTIGDPNSQITEAAWPVVVSYTPYSSDKLDQVLYNNLRLTKILEWEPQIFSQGQVIRNPDVENSFLVVLKSFEYTDASLSPTSFILNGDLSSPKDVVPWQVGNDYYANNQGTGFYDPDLVAFDQVILNNSDCSRLYFEPPGEDNLTYRTNWYVFVVNQDFTLEPSSNTTTGAQTQGLVSNTQVNLPLLKSGGTYEANTWVRTPAVGAGADIQADPYYYYVDITLGVIVRYAYVNKGFTFLPSEGETLADSFNSLVEKGIISVVRTANALGNQSPFQYKARFAPATYLVYRATANAIPQYYFTLTGLTPTTANPQEMVNQGILSRVDTSPELYSSYVAAITPNPQTGLSVVCPPFQMFVFSPGDTTLFRQQGTVQSFVSTKHFTPFFTPGVYINNGILIPGGDANSNAIPFFDSSGLRPAEDFVISVDGKNIYRAIRYFNATETVYNWDGLEVPNTARIEELSGNLLRVVAKYVCEERILAPNGPSTSGTKLGIAQITLRSKSSDATISQFVWENANYASQVPQLSYATGAKEVFNLVDYGDGTLAL
jgi:hypothetical protein